MFYVRPVPEHTRQKWDTIAQIDRLPVLQPAPHKGLWQINAAALNPWSLRSIAAHLARKSKMPRESWVQATSRILTEIMDGFTVNAEEWELVQTPELQDSGVFFVPVASIDRDSYAGSARQFHLGTPAPLDNPIYAAAITPYRWGRGNNLLATHNYV